MAKTATYWQKGESLDYLNKTGAAIPAGTVLKLGAHIGVAGTDIPPEGLGSIHMVGVFKIEKNQEPLWPWGIRSNLTMQQESKRIQTALQLWAMQWRRQRQRSQLLL